MKTRILRALPATIAVVVIAVGSAFAAGVAGGAPPASTQPGSSQPGSSQPASIEAIAAPSALDDDGTADRGSGDAIPAAGDDDGTADRGSGDGSGDVPVRHSGTRDHAVADAGTVTVARDGATLTVTEVAPASGWSFEVERSSGREVEVTFRRDGRRVDFKAEVEHDRIDIRVRER